MPPVWQLTIETKGHLGLERLELLGSTRAGLIAHPLASPLKGAIKLLCELRHDGGMSSMVTISRASIVVRVEKVLEYPASCSVHVT